ncbi:MAG: tetratricopeptide repeat protein [Lachnospiraceae bacterium]|nr:tetratricopeptide repeat protein [Lachnospiraceae bacterium]
MYCIKCGVKNDDDAKFCIGCGESMGNVPVSMVASQNTERQSTENIGKAKKKDKFPFIIVGAVLLVGILTFVIIFATNASPEAKAKKELKLANQYLDEMQYEMAIASYSRVIEIDPKNADAYEGLADTYVAMAEKEIIVGNTALAMDYYDKAIDVLAQGEKETGDDQLENLRHQIERKKAEIDGAGTESDAGTEIEGNTGEVVPKVATEEELKSLLYQNASGNLVESFYDDFNGDGQYEMWAVYWDGDGIDYTAWKNGQMDPVIEQINQFAFGAGDYKQLKIWYVDAEGAMLVDEHTTLSVTEAFVQGQSTYWSRDTFSYLDTVDFEVVSFDDTKQLLVSGTYFWDTGRGLDVDSYLLYSYGNENGPHASFSENQQCDINSEAGNVNRFAYVDGNFVYAVQLRSALKSVVMADSSAWATYHYYPLVCRDGTYKEIESVKIPFDDLYALQNFENVYNDAMDDELLFYTDVIMGNASNVWDINRSFIGLQPQEVLYNDAGYVYINFIGHVTQTSWVSALADNVTEYFEGEPIMLEMKVDGDEILSYRWVEAYQELRATDKESIPSDWTHR